MNIKPIAFCFFWFITVQLHAQKQNYLFLGKTQGVQLIPEDNDSLLFGRIPGWELSYGITTVNNPHDWVPFFNAKYIQLSLVYLDLRQQHGFYNPDPQVYTSGYIRNSLGQQVSLLSSIECQLFAFKGFRLFLTPGFGLSYISTHYFKDPTNRFSGSSINFVPRLEGNIAIRIHPRIEWIVGTRLMHSSNGGWTVPNLGINSWSFKTGLSYFLKK